MGMHGDLRCGAEIPVCQLPELTKTPMQRLVTILTWFAVNKLGKEDFNLIYIRTLNGLATSVSELPALA